MNLNYLRFKLNYRKVEKFKKIIKMLKNFNK